MILYPDMPSLSPIHPKTKGLPWYRAAWNFLTVPTFWRHTDDFIYRLLDGTCILLPYGFTFDGASVPRPFWPLINPDGIMLIPGDLHDFAYRFGCLLRLDNFYEVLEMQSNLVNEHDIRKAFRTSSYKPYESRSFWDKMFMDEGDAINGMWPMNWAAHEVLRCLGWAAWNNWRKKDDENRNQIEIWAPGVKHAGQPQSGSGESKEAAASM
jgi:hypothetical protein